MHTCLSKVVTVAAGLSIVVGGIFSFGPVQAASEQPTSRVRAIAACTKAVAKPHRFVFTCADGGIGLQHAKYTWWSRKTAHGTGRYYFNDCKPDCAGGTFHHQHAEFSLYRVRNTASYGRLFTRIEIDTRKGHHVFRLPTSAE